MTPRPNSPSSSQTRRPDEPFRPSTAGENNPTAGVAAFLQTNKKKAMAWNMVVVIAGK
jgi:hypothetical protein